jgi:hypothetical protein
MPDGTDGTSLTAFGQQTDALKGLWLAAFGVKRRGRLAKGVFVRRSAHPQYVTAPKGPPVRHTPFWGQSSAVGQRPFVRRSDSPLNLGNTANSHG